MSSEKHEVTVYDRVPATASVSVAQVEAYLRLSGWRHHDTTRRGYRIWRGDDAMSDVMSDVIMHDADRADKLALDVEFLATQEKRQPSAVLADIAREIDT